MKKLSLREGVIILLSLLVSCTPTSDDILLEEEITKVEFMLPDSSISADSRMNIVVGSGVKYNWTNTDSIGIFPDDGYQVAFPLKTTGESSSATFTGGGWALKAGSTYAAYYPFEYNNRRSDSIPVSYLGQKQIGNNSTGLADKYNYMYAIGDKTGDNALTFKMLRLGRFIILKFAVPEPTTLSSVKLTAPEDVFITQGYFNLWDNPHVIESLQTSNSLTIDLEDVETTEADEEVTVYFFMPPVDLSGKTLALEVTDEDNVKLQYTVAGKDMTDSKAYALTGVVKEPVVGDGTYQNGVVSLSQAGTMKKLLGDDYLNITSLKVVGPINGDDIYYLRKMLGCSHFSSADWGKLTTLDLSEATIVEGGEWYYESYPGNGYYTSNNEIGYKMFYECANLQNITLPDNVTLIGKYAFEYSNALTEIIIPDGVTLIDIGAFANCEALVKVTILSGEIAGTDNGLSTFSNCSSLISLTIGDGVTSIGERTFEYCSALVDVTIGDGVKSIGSRAFGGCESIKNVYIKSIESWCNIDFISSEYYDNSNYRFCSNPLHYGGSIYLNNELLSILQIPESIVRIKPGTFEGCKSITTLKLADSTTSIGHSAFDDCDGLVSIALGNGVNTMESHAFNDCDALVAIVIPDNVTSLEGRCTFEGCDALTSVTIGNGIVNLGPWTFHECRMLRTVVIGNNMADTGYRNFVDCSLSEVYCYATTPPDVDVMVENEEATLYVPARCGSAYKLSEWGKYFKNIIEMD